MISQIKKTCQRKKVGMKKVEEHEVNPAGVTSKN